MSLHEGKITSSWLPSNLSNRIAQTVSSYVLLTKPKIQVMLLFTAYVAMLVGQHGIPSFRLTVATLSDWGCPVVDRPQLICGMTVTLTP
jgi:heme O synthase-like polyprenyltransferase